MKKSYIYIPVILVGLALFFVVSANRKQPYVCDNCNVILISIDTLGAKHMSLYGHENPTTPFIDKLAKERGVVFNRAISTSAWTLPAHAAMLTSKYPWDLGIWQPVDAIPDSAITIAEVLKSKNYSTQAFSNGGFVHPLFGFDQGFDNFVGNLQQSSWDDMPKIFNDSLSWIDGQSENDKPFFLFVRSFHPHDPYTPENGESVDIDEIVEVNFKSGGATQQDIDKFHNAYDAEIKEFDLAFENFYSSLEESGVLQNTIIILTSDHGEGFGEHGIVGFHGVELYNELVHVPLVFFVPDEAALTIDQVVETRAIPPTIIDLLGHKKELAFEDISLHQNLLGVENEVIAQSATAQTMQGFGESIQVAYENIDRLGVELIPAPRETKWEGPYSFAVQNNAWHLIYNITGDYELYNLNTDFLETQNVFDDWQKLSEPDRIEINALLEVVNNQISN